MQKHKLTYNQALRVLIINSERNGESRTKETLFCNRWTLKVIKRDKDTSTLFFDEVLGFDGSTYYLQGNERDLIPYKTIIEETKN